MTSVASSLQGAGRPTLSVVMPCFNEARFIGEALASLLGQTRPPDEIIVVDDASTDDSAAIVANLAKDNAGLRLLQNPVNRGGVESSNIGLEAVRSDHVFFMADNDIVFPEFFARSLAALTVHPGAGLCSALRWLMSESGKLQSVMPTPLPAAGFIDAATSRRALLADGNWIIGGATIYRTAALRAAGGFDAELLSYCDAFAGPAIAARHGACFIPQALAAWRQHRGGLAATVTRDTSRLPAILARLTARGPGQAPELFTPAYLNRLLRRTRFESLSAMLRQPDPVPPDSWATLAGLPVPLAAALARLALWGRFGRRAARALLFLRLRPFDVPAVLRRRAAWRRAAPAIIMKGFPPNLPMD